MCKCSPRYVESRKLWNEFLFLPFTKSVSFPKNLEIKEETIKWPPQPSNARDQCAWVTRQLVCCDRGWCSAKEKKLHISRSWGARKKTWEKKLRISFAALEIFLDSKWGCSCKSMKLKCLFLAEQVCVQEGLCWWWAQLWCHQPLPHGQWWLPWPGE